jgi:hypothetical protein
VAWIGRFRGYPRTAGFDLLPAAMRRQQHEMPNFSPRAETSSAKRHLDSRRQTGVARGSIQECLAVRKPSEVAFNPAS